MLRSQARGEELELAVALDDALLGWLVESAGGALVTLLRDPAKSAMRRVVEDAVEAAVNEVAGHLEADQAEHLRSSLLVRDTLHGDGNRVGNEAELRTALYAWTAALDHPEYDEPGYLTGLGVDPRRLADVLAARIASGIGRDGRSGGALNPLAEWLWRDDTTTRLARVEANLERLLDAAPRPRSAMPGGTPEFIGRRQALAELAERIQAHDPAGAVVAIHSVDGMAGVGKTEFALRAAHQHKRRYPDGQYFINLHGNTQGIAPRPPETALEELLRQAGVPGPSIPPDLAGRQARWQAIMASQRAIVLLDNALDPDQVRPLLPMSTGCLALITSRSKLAGLPGARALSLDVLPPDEAIELFTRLARSDQSLERNAVAKIVGLVGYLPVAVQAVAGQLRGLTVAELADELAAARDRLDLVDEFGAGGADVRAAFETSLHRLDGDHRQAFGMLGLHPGPMIGVPQFAAIADLPVSHARSTLRTLANRNLVKATRNHIGHYRYELHDLMREFARQQAESNVPVDKRSAAITRLATWYTTAMTNVDRLWDADARSTEPEIEGLRLAGSIEARAWLAAEQENLLAFAELATGAVPANVCYEAGRHLVLLRYHDSARTLLQAALGDSRQAEDQRGTAATLYGLGDVARSAGDHREAGKRYRAALTTAHQAGIRAWEIQALLGLGWVAVDCDKYPDASSHFQSALTIAQQVGDQELEAAALHGLGQSALGTGDYPRAAEHYRAALAVYQETGDKAGESYELWNLGSLAQLTGDNAATSKHFQAALHIAQGIGYRRGEATALRGLGNVAQITGDVAAAIEHHQAALKIFKQIGDRVGENDARFGLAEAARSAGDYSSARKFYRGALANSRHTQQRAGEAFALLGLGSIALDLGNLDEAGGQLFAALDTFHQAGNLHGQALTLWWMGKLAKAQGRPDVARVRWQTILELHVREGSTFTEMVRKSLDALGQD